MQAAAKREVLEESGLTYEPTSLVFVEAPRYNWIRFTLTGTVTGIDGLWLLLILYLIDSV